MRGCLNLLTFLVILAVAVFIVLAVIGWIRDGGRSTDAASDQAGRASGLPVAARVLEVF
jgi:ABC-type transporter Mla subunit MlaD